MRRCTQCLQDIAYIYNRLGSNNTSIYVNVDNKRWYGKICYHCHIKNNREKKQKKDTRIP